MKGKVGYTMKKKWLLSLGLLVLAGILLINLMPQRAQLLENIPPEEVSDGELLIPDGEVPMAEEPPAGDMSLLNDTQIAYVNEVFRLVNEARKANGVAPLRLDEDLCRAAQVRSAECVKVFSHTRPDGTKYKTAITDAGVVAKCTGENVASGYTTPQQVVDGWLKSEGHRANILNAKFTRIGIGLTENTGNKYKGYAWSQLFAND